MSNGNSLPNQYDDEYGYEQPGENDDLKPSEQAAHIVPTTHYGCFKPASSAANSVRSNLHMGMSSDNRQSLLQHEDEEMVSSTVVFLRPPNYMGLSIFTCLCCCWPLGLLALIYSIKSSNAAENMDITRARSTGNKAKCFALLSVLCGLIMFTVIGVIVNYYSLTPNS